MKATTIVKVIFFIIAMGAIAWFLPDEKDEGGAAVLLVIVTGAMALFLLLVMFTDKMDWMYKKPWKNS